MTKTDLIPRVDGIRAVEVLQEHGWTQGTYGGDGEVCLHGAIRLCSPVPGDAYLIEQIEAHRDRWSTDWNDTDGRTRSEVEAVLLDWPTYTDEDLADTFGPQWRAVVALVRRAAVLTPDEVPQLAAAWDAAWAAAWDAAWDAAWAAARDAAWAAARAAAWDAARAAARDAARDAAGYAAGYVSTWDLATVDGPYTIAHRDLLIAPWVDVCGLPAGLLEETS